MKKGDIVLIKFPYTNFKNSKKRPSLILFVGTNDVTVCFISTKLKWKEENDLILTPSKSNGLKKCSLIKLSKIITIDKDLLLGKLGFIDSKT